MSTDHDAGRRENWRLVPVEPTEAMLKAGVREINRGLDDDAPEFDVWGVMLAEVPTPEPVEGDEGSPIKYSDLRSRIEAIVDADAQEPVDTRRLAGRIAAMVAGKLAVSETARRAAEAEVAKLRCPIGMDNSRQVCSAGTCYGCRGDHLEYWREMALATETALATSEAAHAQTRARCEVLEAERDEAMHVLNAKDADIVRLATDLGDAQNQIGLLSEPGNTEDLARGLMVASRRHGSTGAMIDGEEPSILRAQACGRIEAERLQALIYAVTAIERKLDAAQARITVLEEALRPFVNGLLRQANDWSDDDRVLSGTGVTAGEVRRAATAPPQPSRLRRIWCEATGCHEINIREATAYGVAFAVSAECERCRFSTGWVNLRGPTSPLVANRGGEDASS